MALQGGGAGGSTAGTAGPNVDILPSVELVLGHLSQTGTSCPVWSWFWDTCPKLGHPAHYGTGGTGSGAGWASLRGLWAALLGITWFCRGLSLSPSPFCCHLISSSSILCFVSVIEVFICPYLDP